MAINQDPRVEAAMKSVVKGFTNTCARVLAQADQLQQEVKDMEATRTRFTPTVIRLTELILEEEGATVEFACSNPEPRDLSENEVVTVSASWTNWQPHDYRGSTVEICLQNAMDEAPAELKKKAGRW